MSNHEAESAIKSLRDSNVQLPAFKYQLSASLRDLAATTVESDVQENSSVLQLRKPNRKGVKMKITRIGTTVAAAAAVVVISYIGIAAVSTPAVSASEIIDKSQKAMAELTDQERAQLRAALDFDPTSKLAEAEKASDLRSVSEKEFGAALSESADAFGMADLPTGPQIDRKAVRWLLFTGADGGLEGLEVNASNIPVTFFEKN